MTSQPAGHGLELAEEDLASSDEGEIGVALAVVGHGGDPARVSALDGARVEHRVAEGLGQGDDSSLQLGFAHGLGHLDLRGVQRRDVGGISHASG